MNSTFAHESNKQQNSCFWTTEHTIKVALTSKRTFMAALSAGTRTVQTSFGQVRYIVRHLMYPP